MDFIGFRVKLFLLALWLLAFTPSVEAEWFDYLGAQAGATYNEDKTFTSLEGIVGWELPWTWQGSSGISLNTDAEASLGLLRGDGSTIGIASIGPRVIINALPGQLGFDVGIRMALMSRTKINGLDFGTALQFISHLGLSWRMGEHFEVGYQYQHMSNGGMNNSNPGLNMHVLRLNYYY